MLRPRENPPTPRTLETPPTAVTIFRFDITAGCTVLRIVLGINLAMHGIARLLAGFSVCGGI